MSRTPGCAVVTGAAGGVGSAVVQALLQDGWSVVGVDQCELHVSLATAERLSWVVGDVRDDATVAEALATAGEGGVSGLVTATIADDRDPLEELDRHRIAAVLDAMVTTAWAWSTAVALAAPEGEASIVHVSSVHAVGAAASMAPYAMSKAALGALARASALEWGPRGIRCNVVMPGFVPVERNQHRWSDPEETAALSDKHPLRRLVMPEDVANAVAFLLGVKSQGITGAVLPVDGGMLAALPTWA